MNEMLLQFIWQYSLYTPVGLQTTAGETLTIVHPGVRNHDSGPDFSGARVKIGDTMLVGNVEIHCKSSDWKKHGHDSDGAYRNIILHVVFDDDLHLENPVFPTLELCRHIPAYVLDRYTNLIQTTQPVACARQLGNVNELVKQSWLHRLLAERWEQKLGDWKDLLQQSAGDWRLLLYWRMAANFGFKVNATPFLMLAQSIPLTVLGRHKDNLMQVEAMLFGQAGMLQGDFRDEYPRQLQAEYEYLRKKYSFQPVPGHLWKFLRMRPVNFPSVRIAQFAALIHRSLHLFSKIVDSFEVKDIRELLHVTASDYWRTHFRFDDETAHESVKKLGNSSIDNIIINTVAPVQFLYAHDHGRQADQERAIQLLSSVKAENNNVISTWKEHQWLPENALQSQALLQLFNNYCNAKRCLECAVGLNIIKSIPKQ